MYLREEEVRSAITLCMKVIHMYDWLLDLYVLDFFVDDHWNKLPLTWQEAFQDMDPQQLGEILSGKSTNHILPLSFLALKKSVNALCISRVYNHKINNDYIQNTNQNTCGNHPKLKNLFLKHVKLKKRHEISLMADIVNTTAKSSKCEGLIDFGSGLGHLVRMLAYKYNLYAAGIECQDQLTEEARKLDLQLEYTASKHLSADVMKKLRRPVHLNITLSSQKQLDQLALPETIDTYGLVGLHPCGDLTPLLLKHFVDCKKVKYICVVGCCYMKLNNTSEAFGYPMSQYLQGMDNTLSYVSREIACHAIEVYCELLEKGDYKDLKVHAFRAALERLLVDHDPKLRHAPVRSIKHSETMTFQNYCTLAVERVGVALPSCPRSLSQGERDLQQWKRVVSLYTLRLMLAPLVETVILLDRVLYVLENDLSCEIRPVFDPKISPRNHIIIARRS